METKSIEKWFESIEIIRTMVGTMPVQQISVFTYIALNPGCTSPDIEKALDMKQVAVGRSVRKLSDLVVKNRDGVRTKTGYELIVNEPDPEDPRRHIFHLTKKGERIIGLVIDIFG